MKPYIITLLGYKGMYLGDKEIDPQDRKDEDFCWAVNGNQVVVYGNDAVEAVNRYIKKSKYVGTFLVSSPMETETQVVLVEPKSETDTPESETPNNVPQ